MAVESRSCGLLWLLAFFFWIFLDLGLAHNKRTACNLLSTCVAPIFRSCIRVKGGGLYDLESAKNSVNANEQSVQEDAAFLGGLEKNGLLRWW